MLTKPEPDRLDRLDRSTTTGVDVCECSGEVGYVHDCWDEVDDVREKLANN